MSPGQIYFPRFWDRIMTIGPFFFKRVTYLCPFLTMCTGPKRSTLIKSLVGCTAAEEEEEEEAGWDFAKEMCYCVQIEVHTQTHLSRSSDREIGQLVYIYMPRYSGRLRPRPSNLENAAGSERISWLGFTANEMIWQRYLVMDLLLKIAGNNWLYNHRWLDHSKEGRCQRSNWN